MLARALGLVGAAAWFAAQGAAGQLSDSMARVRARFWARPLASLVLPGSGQLLAHQDRAAVYLATELYALSRFVQLNLEGGRESDRFRAIAFQVAQRGFTTVQRDTVFEYYKTMQRFLASGRYNAGPGPTLQPEPDANTYNGSIWLLARRTYWTDPNTPPPPTSPAYANALAFYATHAVGPAFLWSWRDSELQQQAFREAIRRSDDAFRGAQNQLGLLLANHLVSAIDALISSRLALATRRPVALETRLGDPSIGALRITL